MGFLTSLAGYYEAKIECSNCFTKSMARIRKGITKEEYLADIKNVCPVCGCETIEFQETIYKLLERRKNNGERTI